MREKLLLGICQLRQSYDIDANLTKTLRMLNAAADSGAGMAVLPEMFLCPYEPAAIRAAREHTARAAGLIAETAASRGLYVVAGSMSFPSGGGLPTNRSVVFGPDGTEVHHHDKIHLFDCAPPDGPAVRESELVAAGEDLAVFSTPWGNAAVMVCYDIRFVQLTQLLADRDVAVLIVPAAFSMATGRAHWEMLVRMRAIELQAFVAGVQPANNPELNYVPWGHSLVADPWGEIVLDCGSDEGVCTAAIEFSRLAEIRERFPLLRHRRSDLYETVWKKR